MTIKLTDAQISRLFELAAKVVAIQQSIPVPPANFASRENTRIEIAKALRSSLESQTDMLLELGALLRPESEWDGYGTGPDGIGTADMP